MESVGSASPDTKGGEVLGRGLRDRNWGGRGLLWGGAVGMAKGGRG